MVSSVAGNAVLVIGVVSTVIRTLTAAITQDTLGAAVVQDDQEAGIAQARMEAASP